MKNNKEKEKEKSKSFSIITMIISILFLLSSVSFALYPTISEALNKIANRNRNTEYLHAIERLSESAQNDYLKEAKEYNERLQEPLEYDSIFSYKNSDDYINVLNFDSGQMGSIVIPKIDVDLPIYHGTGEDKLSQGAVHMPNTAVPIGGIGNHSCISAHTAYPAKVFFDNLNQLDNGDYFFIRVLDETLTYKVVDKNIVEPTDISLLQINQKKDLITLVTCFPYAINSHRLLVTGERVPDSENVTLEENQAEYGDNYEFKLFFIAAVMLLVFLAIILFLFVKKYRKTKSNKKQPNK